MPCFSNSLTVWSRKRASSAGVRAQFEHPRHPRGPDLERRRIVGRGQEASFALGHELAVLLGIGLGLHPVRVGGEGIPRLLAGVLARVTEEVHQLVVLVVADRHEVADVGHAVLLEQLDGVVAEAGVERVELAGRGVVHAHLVDAGVLGVLLVVGRGGHGERESESQNGKQE